MVEEADKRAPIPFEDQPTLHSPYEGPTVEGPVSTTLKAAPASGDRVGGYIIESTIGHGGMGIVVAAIHAASGERVAIKLLHPKAAKDAVQVERFVREARSTARIKSDYVVRVLDAGAEDGTNRPYIVMEFLQGRDLGYVLSQFGAMPMQTAVDYIIQICEAVAAAHAVGVVHRDLKPSNFFLTQRADGTALLKVLDFGISKALQSDGTPDPRLTETQAVFGSPTYMSPEQIRSSKNVDQRSDLWSLGVALFEMLTGKLPFVADNVAGLLASVIADPPFRLAAFVPNIPPMVEAIVHACLEKDPARRIGSAAELAARLAPFASPAGAALASRVERHGHFAGVGSGSHPSLPPPAPVSASGAPPPISGISYLPPMPLPSLSAPVAFGITGNDLSATGPAAFRATVRRGQGRALALGVVAALVFVGAVGGIFYLTRSPSQAGADKGESAGPPPATSAALPVTDAPIPTVIAPPSAEPASAASSAVGPGNRRGKPGAGPGGGHGHTPPRASAASGGAAVTPPTMPTAPTAPATPPATPPASPNLDSRF